MAYKEHDAYAVVLGKVVAHLRQKRSWTQGQLAVQVGLQQSTISRIEGGTLSPDPFTFRLIAGAFGMTGEELQRRVDAAYQRTQQTAQSATGPQAGNTPWWQSALGVAGVIGLAGLAVFAVAAVLDEMESETKGPRHSGRRD